MNRCEKCDGPLTICWRPPVFVGQQGELVDEPDTFFGCTPICYECKRNRSKSMAEHVDAQLAIRAQPKVPSRIFIGEEAIAARRAEVAEQDRRELARLSGGMRGLLNVTGLEDLDKWRR